MNLEEFFIISIIIMTGIFIVCLLVFFIFPFLSLSYDCDTGKINITGDYEVTPNTSFNQLTCAVQDCLDYNTYYNETRCVV
jgi:hypothetical protein